MSTRQPFDKKKCYAGWVCRIQFKVNTLYVAGQTKTHLRISNPDGTETIVPIELIDTIERLYTDPG